MTDDFHLFADPVDKGAPIDPDVALVSAYLSRELSPMQILSLEERLATDAGFRDAVQPIIDAWAAPVASLDAAPRHAPLSMRERTESWKRFRDELYTEQPAGITTQPAADLIPSPTSHDTRRRVSMKRVIALLGITAIPVLTFAQAVTYAAAHDGAPGHAIAGRIAALFAHTPQLSEPNARIARSVPAVGDGPVGRQLHPTAATPAAAESATVAHVGASGAERRPAFVLRRSPDRRQVAALVRLAQPRLVSGDTAADYAVIVVDAGDDYLWSTIGSGNVSIEVGGDQRSVVEQASYAVQNRAEFIGALDFGDGRGRVGEGARGAGRGSGGGRSGGGGRVILADTTIIDRVTGELHRSQTQLSFDTLVFQKFDSLGSLYSRLRGTDVGRGRRVFRGDSLSERRSRGAYRVVWAGLSGGESFNRAYGLVDPAPGESGIRGLPAAGVSLADIYRFQPGELVSTAPLTVMVVRLTPGTAWRGQF